MKVIVLDRALTMNAERLTITGFHYFGTVKKAACLILLLPIFLHSGGMLLVCMLLQLNHHQNIEAILGNSSTKFEKFVLSADDFQKAKKDDKEIYFSGKIYDVKEIYRSGETVELVAYHDAKEESLFSLIEKFFDDESSGSDFSLQVLKLLVTVYTFSPQYFEFSSPMLSGVFTQPNSVSYLSFSGETLTPPPDAVS